MTLLLHLEAVRSVLGADLLQFLIEMRLLIGREQREDPVAQRACALRIARAADGMRLRVLPEEVLRLLLLRRRQSDRREAFHPAVVRVIAGTALTLYGCGGWRDDLCRDGNRQGQCREGRGHKQDFHGTMIPGRPGGMPEGRIRKADLPAGLPGEFQRAWGARDDLEFRAAGVLEEDCRIGVEVGRALDAFSAEAL